MAAVAEGALLAVDGWMLRAQAVVCAVGCHCRVATGTVYAVDLKAENERITVSNFQYFNNISVSKYGEIFFKFLNSN